MIRIPRSFLATRSRPSLLSFAVMLVAGIGAADYATGYDLALGIFYIVPIALLAWHVSRLAGVFSAFTSAVVWYYVNSAFAPPEVGQGVVIWNSAVRFGFFVVIATLLSSLRRADHLMCGGKAARRGSLVVSGSRGDA